MPEYEAIKMSLRAQASCLAPYLKRMRTVKFFFFISFTSLAVFLIWTEHISRLNPPSESLIQEALMNVARDFRYTNVYRKTTYLPKNLKYILLWTRRDWSPLSSLEDGQRSFLKHNCSFVNCYVTADRRFLGSRFTDFHAILFNGRNMNPYNRPRVRSPHQKYIYINMESSSNYPHCHIRYDGFFNLTATYKLNSDIPLPYITIRNMKGEIVGPKLGMEWKQNMTAVGNEYMDIIENKTKAAAWFVSNCKTKSKRERLATKLGNALWPYDYRVDSYGLCSKLRCSRSKAEDCNLLLRRDYFFYLSFENSLAEDYVTEKVLTALDNNVVPVVFGGANYSRFLPPGSYIDANKNSVYQIAAIMDRLAHMPSEYTKYFSWKKHYKFDFAMPDNICRICEALNDDNIMKRTTIYHNFRAWWNPEYEKHC